MIYKHKNYRKLTIVLLIVGICLGLILVSCSDDDTDDILPNVVLSVNALNFEQVEIGEFRPQTVTVTNLTSGNVIVERVTSTNQAFQVGGYFANNQLVVLETPFTIEGKGSRTIYIVFYPEEAKEYVGKVVIESTTQSTSKQETDLVDLQGVGVLSEE